MSSRIILISLVVSICVKCLLWPSYRSTDFDVHRNWKSIVQLPVSQWYFENTCEWTLDYPPFFAYFEYALSSLAMNLMPGSNMLQIEQYHNAENATVQFMRSTVIVSDLVLVYAIWNYCHLIRCSRAATGLSMILVVLNGGLLLIDHVHFQYNGMLLGLLILCCACAHTGNYLVMAALFCLLVLSKHLFAPFALVFAAYLIKHYCVSRPTADGLTASFSLRRFLHLLNIALFALLLAFGPFVWGQFKDDLAEFGNDPRYSHVSIFLGAAKAQLVQMGVRLFPFGRGLLHAYPAANVWVLYYALDRLVLVVGKRLGLPLDSSGLSFTSGIVTDIAPHVLPKVTAVHCLSLVVAALMPVLYKIAVSPHDKVSPSVFVKSLLFCSLSTFMLGYHVHEKAILICIILCSLLVCRNMKTAVSDQGSPAGTGTVDDSAADPEHVAAIKTNELEKDREAGVALLMLRLCLIGVYSLFPLFSSSPAMLFPKGMSCGVWSDYS